MTHVGSTTGSDPQGNDARSGDDVNVNSRRCWGVCEGSLCIGLSGIVVAFALCDGYRDGANRKGWVV